jgi:hypothetical protein
MLEGVGIILMGAALLYAVNFLFQKGQKITGVKLVQSYEQKRNLESENRNLEYSLSKLPENLIQRAKKECARKHHALNATNIYEEVLIIKSKEGLKFKEDFPYGEGEPSALEYSKEAEKRLRKRNWFVTLNALNVVEEVSRIRMERYPRNYFKLNTHLTNEAISVLVKELLIKNNLDNKALSSNEYGKMKREIEAVTSQLQQH